MTSTVLQRVEITLRSFYIFNSHFGMEEGEEHKKVLYYHPTDIEQNIKIRDVGLSEAIIQFTGTFTADDGCKALHTQKTTQLFYQPEPDYWMVLVLNVPKEVRTKDGVEVAEYRGCEVHDRFHRAALQQCYHMFRLSSGTFRMNLLADGVENDDAREQLQQRLAAFFDKKLAAMRLPSCDLLHLMRSTQYLPLEKCLFLRAHNFINMIRATFPTIQETVLFYNDQVLCNGQVTPIDLYSLREYIVSTLLPSDVAGASLVRGNNTATDLYHNGAFITGLADDDQTKKAPKIFLKSGDMLHAYYLLVFRALDATLCLLVNADGEPPNGDFYTELHAYMGPQLSSIARDIGETLMKPQTVCGSATASAVGLPDTDAALPKYLYINEQSLKHLSNIPFEQRRSKNSHCLPTNIMHIIGDLNNGETMNSDSSPLQEVQVKTTNDFWIVKRRCNWRQCYVIIFNSKATLLDVTQESKRIFEKEFTDDVFFDK